MAKKADVTKLDDEIYSKSKVTGMKLIIAFIFFTIIFVISNLSLGQKALDQLEKSIQGTPSCPFTHKGLEISWFLPKILIKAPSLPSSCFNRFKGSPLKLETIPISFGIPSVYPPGLKLHSEIKPLRGKSKINIYPIIGFGTHFLKITETIIDEQLIAEITGKNLVEGIIETEANLQFDNSGLLAGDILLKSKNFQIKSQTIEGLTLPQLRLNHLQLKANLNKTKLNILSLISGDDQAPLYLGLSGNIRLNKYNMGSSKIELEGDIRFSPDLIAAFPAINLFLSGKESQGGLYRIQISGSLNSPIPRIL